MTKVNSIFDLEDDFHVTANMSVSEYESLMKRLEAADKNARRKDDNTNPRSVEDFERLWESIS